MKTEIKNTSVLFIEKAVVWPIFGAINCPLMDCRSKSTAQYAKPVGNAEVSIAKCPRIISRDYMFSKIVSKLDFVLNRMQSCKYVRNIVEKERKDGRKDTFAAHMY